MAIFSQSMPLPCCPFVGKMADKHGFVKVLLPAMGCFALAFLLISYSVRIEMFLLAGFISAFGYGACQPTVQALCMKCVPKEKRGAGSTTNYIGQDLGNLVGPTMAGAVAGRLGYGPMWRFMMIPIFMAMLIVVIFRKQISNTIQ